MQYLAAILAFLAVLAGVRGNTWDSKRRKPTPIGWTAVVVGTASMVVSIIGAYRNHVQLDWQVAQRTKVRAVAQVDLREAVGLVQHTFGILYDNAQFEYNLKPRKDADAIEFSRFREPRFREIWSHFGLRRHPDVFPTATWWQLFTDNAALADNKLNSAVMKYSAYLEADELLLIHALQNDFFFRWRLIDLPTLMKANAHIKDLQIDFILEPDKGKAYLTFVDKLEALSKRLSATNNK